MITPSAKNDNFESILIMIIVASSAAAKDTCGSLSTKNDI
jgi:hypothetical protein